MKQKITIITIVVFSLCLTSCKSMSSVNYFVSTPTSTPTNTPTNTPTLIPSLTPSPTSTLTPTLTPSLTPTRVMLSRVIPKNFYNIVKMKYTAFRDGKEEAVCVLTTTHKASRVESDEVIEITEHIDLQKVSGNFCPYQPESKNFKLNVFTGE